MADATVLVVTQRIATAKNADVILVLDGGCVVAAGTHEELLASCGYYADIVSLQNDWEAAS